MSGYIPQYEFPNAMTQWQPYNQYEISPSSSFSNFTEEVEHGDGLSRFGCMSPYSDYMGFSGNEDIPYEGYDQYHNNSLRNPKPF